MRRPLWSEGETGYPREEVMTLKATTPHPDEVRKHFLDYADILDVYAEDQIASLRWPGSKAHKHLSAQLYRDIAKEMRSIVFEEGELDT